MLTAADIEAGRTARGGFTRATLASWGVPWPPPRGWRRRLLAGQPVERADIVESFHQLSHHRCPHCGGAIRIELRAE
jgi:hypothetical protein